jgi:hypothetical protein
MRLETHQVRRPIAERAGDGHGTVFQGSEQRRDELAAGRARRIEDDDP